MADYFEIDYLDVEADKSGDAIPLRYQLNGTLYIHVVDGGFQDTGTVVVGHVNRYYGNPKRIDHVVVTHPDADHAGGLRTVLAFFEIGALWMLRPWIYASTLIDRFPNYTSVDNLARRLRKIYPNLAALEEIALDRRIPIFEPFQGASIGAFAVLAPSKPRYLELILTSEKTPEAEGAQRVAADSLGTLFEGLVKRATTLVKSAWGEEIFPEGGTSAENEMSVIQYARLCGTSILLTADAGRDALTEAADYATNSGVPLPGVDRFQVPHHGSRHNVSTVVLDRWLGPRLPTKKVPALFRAHCSAAQKDKDHPRRSVKRAIIHRGGEFYDTKEGESIWTSVNAPKRSSYSPLTASAYPEDQEE